MLLKRGLVVRRSNEFKIMYTNANIKVKTKIGVDIDIDVNIDIK